MTVTPSVVLLASGGLDSTTLAYSLLRQNINFLALFINYGQHSAQSELEALRHALPENVRLEVIDLSAIYRGSSSRMIVEPDLWNERVEDDDLYLPHRNLLLLTVAAAITETRGLRDIYAGFIETHRAPGKDCCDPFFAQLDAMFELTGAVKLHLPFRRMSKKEVAQLGISMGAPIGETYSCLAASRVPCGACPNCVDRLQALDSLVESDGQH